MKQGTQARTLFLIIGPVVKLSYPIGMYLSLA
jgi:hypothetical protein